MTNRRSVIQVPNQSIIVPDSSTNTRPMTRRSVLQRGGAVAASASLGASLLLPSVAHAATTVTRSTQVGTYSEGTFGRTYTIWNTTGGGILVVVSQLFTPSAYVYRGSNTRFFNTGTLSGSTYTLTNEIASIPNSYMEDSDNGRRLVDINWGNQASDVISETSSLAGYSDAVTLFWEKFTRAGTFYFASTINDLAPEKRIPC